MIHSLAIRVTCDARWCDPAQVFIPFLVGNPLPSAHDVEWVLETEHEWIVRDGRHFCCQVCADAPLRQEP